MSGGECSAPSCKGLVPPSGSSTQSESEFRVKHISHANSFSSIFGCHPLFCICESIICKLIICYVMIDYIYVHIFVISSFKSSILI